MVFLNFFYLLFSCNFDDQLSQNFHSFFIYIYACIGMHKVKILVFVSDQTFPVSCSTADFNSQNKTSGKFMAIHLQMQCLWSRNETASCANSFVYLSSYINGIFDWHIRTTFTMSIISRCFYRQVLMQCSHDLFVWR